jgi:PAS domain S-box-containing protein
MFNSQDIDENNFSFIDACVDADILILDTPPAQIPEKLRDLCAALHPSFVYCERPERGLLPAERLADFTQVWTAPITPERIRFFFSQLLERIKLQQDLWLEHTWLDTTIDSVPDLVWFKDLRGSHLEVNEAFCKLVGKTKEQCRGRGHYYIWDMDPAEYGKGEYVCLESEDVVIKARKTCVFDEKIKGPKGMLQFKTYKSPIFDQDGKIIGTMGVARDVSNFQQLSDEFRLVLNSIPTAALMVDGDGSIVMLNKELMNIIHADAVQLIGTSYRNWKNAIFHIDRQLQPNERIQVTYQKDDGSTIQLEICEEPIYDIFHQLNGYFCLFRDVTEHLNHLDLLLNYQKQLEVDVTAKTEQIRSMQQQVLISFADLINSRDNITGSHIRNTSKYVHIIVDELRSCHTFPELDDAEYCDNIIRSAPMHDMGKIAIPDVILNTPGKFTPEEYEIMKEHSIMGGEILEQVLKGMEDLDYYQIARDMAIYHHEKWNGTGYPYGKKEEDIPLCARIMAVADVFDALVSQRPYKKAFTVDQAYDIIQHDSGIHFDPKIVDVFVSVRTAIEMAMEDESMSS